MPTTVPSRALMHMLILLLSQCCLLEEILATRYMKLSGATVGCKGSSQMVKATNGDQNKKIVHHAQKPPTPNPISAPPPPCQNLAQTFGSKRAKGL